MEIKGSAYRHHIDEADMIHALSYPVRRFTMPDGVVLWIGPATDGSFLEVAVNKDGAIIHAMPARLKFLK